MSVINALQVRCPATRAQLKQDEADATEDVSTLCNAVANRCDWQGTLGDFVEKHRDHECPLRKVKCPLGCPAMIFACDVETHTQKECPSRPVSSWAVKKPPPAENNKERAIFSTVNGTMTEWVCSLVYFLGLSTLIMFVHALLSYCSKENKARGNASTTIQESNV